MSEPKQFWIYEPKEKTKGMGAIATTEISMSLGNNHLRKKPIKVIEYSAYEKIKQQVKDYEQALKQYSDDDCYYGRPDLAREVLKKWSGV